MVLEMEIERIAGWVEHRVMPPNAAARALRNLLACYVRASQLNRNLTVFEQFAHALFERHFHGTGHPRLAAVLIERAWRLLDTSTGPASAITRLSF
ncbi:hypothetical protein PQU92_07730 [Asticcacaulis sp. BYS171W]|uniref:Tetratricopeptide repeat protein n=1 Tax=Asticcacaulis aquaticus TaxID=2984212 RepID=A0ABT5HSW2_9CAUL|nr:hypothetical protein [Asticcacaulis aquaticus]MDC7683163.1 hypothetical protein [Asticcacaulis aquaticus]